MVALGIAPDRAETGYGYIRLGEAMEGGHKVDRFVEKPDRDTAERFLTEGNYAWNGGIFAFRAGAFMDELERHRPAMAEAVRRAVAGDGASPFNDQALIDAETGARSLVFAIAPPESPSAAELLVGADEEAVGLGLGGGVGVDDLGVGERIGVCHG